MIIITNWVDGICRVESASGLPRSYNPEPNSIRLKRLAQAESGSGHDCALKGIVVSHTIEASQAFLIQWQRYHFHDIVSSTSKMANLNEIIDRNLNNENPNIKTWARWSKNNQLLGYGEIEDIIMAMPLGVKLKWDAITNYLQLKTIYRQRQNHKLSEWKQYCRWIEELPKWKGWVLNENY